MPCSRRRRQGQKSLSFGGSRAAGNRYGFVGVVVDAIGPLEPSYNFGIATSGFADIGQVSKGGNTIVWRMSAHRVVPPTFKLQFDRTKIAALAARYSYPSEDRIVEVIGPAARQRGYYTRSEFIEVCRWKTERSRSRVAENSEEQVVEATRLALSVNSEALRIWIPMALSGVQWATASVLLHIGHRDRYPILDYRVLAALGIAGKVTYTVTFWNAYVAVCRALDDETGLGMRTIDRAMWQWSKEQDENR